MISILDFGEANLNITDGAFSISHDELLKIGAPESSVKLPPDSGGGYMAWLEVFHQLHCLVSFEDLTPV